MLAMALEAMTRCPSCLNARHPSPTGWGELYDTHELWRCLWCKAVVCNEDLGAATCYVKHTEQLHGKRYR